MQILTQWIKPLAVVALFSVATVAYAESAPVYDADSMQQQYDTDAGYGDIPPPPPGQEGAFVPGQQPVSSASAPLSMDQRLRRLEQQINNLQNGDTSPRIDSLQNQVQNLRGQVEQLTHQVQELQNQQKTLLLEVDKRASQSVNTKASTGSTEASSGLASLTTLKSLRKPSKVEPTKPTDTSSTTDQPNVAEEQQIYQTAYNLIKAKRYEDAVNTLQGMLKKYPSGQFASNAHYWLGELYGLMGKNDQALSEFNIVLKSYADSPRVSDAQLKVGLIYASQSKWSEAKAAFKKVINRYPGTGSARLASEHLKEIKQAGN